MSGEKLKMIGSGIRWQDFVTVILRCQEKFPWKAAVVFYVNRLRFFTGVLISKMQNGIKFDLQNFF